MEYVMLFWGKLSESKKVFQLQKKILWITTRSQPRDSCKPLFWTMEILNLPPQYILISMTLLIHILYVCLYISLLTLQVSIHKRNYTNTDH